MKRFNNLYGKIFDIENIKLAHENAKKGKLHYSEVIMVDSKPDFYLGEISEMLKNKTYKNSPYKTMLKNDYGKERLIHKLPYYPDRIIHHAIMQVVEPIWFKTLIRDTYASLKNRGIHDGVKRIKLALKDKENTTYCLKMDVRKFYPSIDNEILKNIIRLKIKDNDLLSLLDMIIDSTPGVPIGNYLSQYFGNIYLSGLDHYVKSKNKYYFRYCDDMVLMNASKKELHILRVDIENYLNTNLKLKLKRNYQVFPIDKRGIDFLGYRFFHGYTLLRKTIKAKFVKKARNILKKHTNLSPSKIVNTIMSYWGWFKYSNCKNLQNKYINNEMAFIFKQISIDNHIKNPLRKVS